MKWRSRSAVSLAMALSVLVGQGRMSWADTSGAALLEGERWDVLGMVTGFHTVVHKRAGFEARLLEADGSASVAQNPVALFLVATNNGTSDLIERIWRLERGVARVRGVSASACGVDIRVDVDRIDSEGLVRGAQRKTLHACFISPEGKLLSAVMVTEAPR